MNEEILSRLASLEQRLSRIENIMGAGRKPVPAPPPRESAPQPPIPQTPEMVNAPEAIGEQSSSSSKILGSIAVLCFIGAAAFLIDLAISAGWLTPQRQILLAGLFGCFLVGTGLYFRAKDAGYLSLLSAAGVVILDLTLLGGYGIYRLYDAEIAVMGIAAVSVLCVYLYVCFQSEWYAVLSVIGAYSSLFLLRGDLDAAALTTYYLVWDLAFAIIAFHVKSRTMILLSAYLGLWGYQVKMRAYTFEGSDLLLFVASVQAIQFLLFCITSVAFSVRHQRPFSTAAAWAFFPLLVFFYGIEYWLLYRWSPALAPWAAIGFALALYAFYFAAKLMMKAKTLHSASLLSALGSLVLLHAVYWNLLSERIQLWLGPVLLLLLPALWKRCSLGKENICYAMTFIFIALLSLFQVFFGNSPYPSELVALSGAYFIAFGVLYFAGKRAGSNSQLGGAGFLLLLFSFSQFMLGSLRFFVRAGESVSLVQNFRPFWISSSWGIFGLISLLAARHLKDQTLAMASLFLLACTTLKVLLFDVASSSPIIRISCLLITGAVLYAGGYLLRSIKSWK